MGLHIAPYHPGDPQKQQQIYGALKECSYLHKRQELVFDVADKLEQHISRECPNMVNSFMGSEHRNLVGCMVGKIFMNLGIGLGAALEFTTLATATYAGGLVLVAHLVENFIVNMEAAAAAEAVAVFGSEAANSFSASSLSSLALSVYSEGGPIAAWYRGVGSLTDITRAMSDVTIPLKRDSNGRSQAASFGNKFLVARRGVFFDYEYQKKGYKESLSFDPGHATQECEQSIKVVGDALRRSATIMDDPKGLSKQMMELFGGNDADVNAKGIVLWAANPPDLEKKLEDINFSALASKFWGDGQCLAICVRHGNAPKLSCNDNYVSCPRAMPDKICQAMCYHPLHVDNEPLRGLDRLRDPPWRIESSKVIIDHAVKVYLSQDPARFIPGTLSFDLSHTSKSLGAPVPHLLMCVSDFMTLEPLEEHKDHRVPWNCGNRLGSETLPVMNNLYYDMIDEKVRERIFKWPHEQAHDQLGKAPAAYMANMCRVYFGGLYQTYREKDKFYYEMRDWCQKITKDIDDWEAQGRLWSEMDAAVCDSAPRELPNKVRKKCKGHQKDLPFCNAVKTLHKKLC